MTGTGPLVLVAEDQPLASLALRAQLEVLDYQVMAAHDGEEAIALGACFPVELGLFDFRMPRCNGVDAARALFEMAPTPVVLLSGFDPVSLPEPLPRPPIFASLTKPADLNDLRNALAAAATGFASWIAAQPGREDLVMKTQRERTTIADAINNAASDEPSGRVARQLLEQARREHLPLVDVARQTLHPER